MRLISDIGLKIHLSSMPLIAVLIIFTITALQTVSETRRLQEELAEYVAPPVTIDAKTYTLTSGHVFYNGDPTSILISKKVLRIAEYSVKNRLNPIFSIESTDPELFEDSIILLTKSLDTYVSIYEKKGRDDEAKTINETLYPIDFLSKLTELEKLRRLVVTNPSEKIVKDYNQQLDTTIDTYISYIDKLKKNFEKFSKRGGKTLAYWGGTNTVKSTILSLDTAKKSATKRNNERIRRYSCFKKGGVSCVQLSEHMQESIHFNRQQ